MKTPAIRSLNTFMSLVISAILFLAIAGLVVYVADSSYENAIQSETRNMIQVGASLRTSINDILDNAQAQVQALAHRESTVSALRNGSPLPSDDLKSLLEARTDLNSIYIVDKRGVIVSGYNYKGKSTVGLDLSDRSYVKAILAGAAYFAEDIVPQKSTGDLVAAVASPVRDASGSVVGGVVATINWDRFMEKYVLPIKVGETGYAYLLDAKGALIAHPQKELMLKDMSGLPVVQEALAKKKGVYRYVFGGKKKIQTFDQVERAGWEICVTADDDELASLARSQRNALVAGGAGLYVVLLAAIMLLLRRQVVVPLRAVMAYASEVAHGNLKAELTGSFRFEMRALAENIRHMTGELKTKLGFAEGVLGGIPTSCGIVGPDFRMLWVNRQVCELLDKPGSPEDYVGMKSGEFFWNDPNRETLSDKAIRLKAPQTAQARWTSPSGSKRLHVAITTTPFHDMDGAMLGSISFWHDVTDLVSKQREIEAQRDKIAEAAKRASDISAQLSAASEELSAQIEESSRGAANQKIRTTETATAVDQMNASILEVAKNSSSAATSAEAARSRAAGGADAVRESVKAIEGMSAQVEEMKNSLGELGKQAEDIGSVIDIISDIADQTNLLALNAAIEAARAGEAGRGFAVVADEVRKLAEKTMTATKDVSQAVTAIQSGTRRSVGLMDKAAQDVEASVTLAENAGGSLGEIVSMASATADMVRSIATAAEEQSAASEQIARSTEEVNSVASETADAMSQSAQAISDLARMAEELNAVIGDMRSA